MILYMALAGALGSICRFLLSTLIQIKFSKVSLFATTIVNVIGSFLLGVSFALHVNYPSVSNWYTIVGTGFFGAFTTFSSFSYEALLIYLKFPKKGVLFILANIFIVAICASLGIIFIT